MTDVTPIPKRTVELAASGPGWSRRRPVNPESARRLAQREERADCRNIVLTRDRHRCQFHKIAGRHWLPVECQGAPRPHGWSTGLEVHEVITRARGGDPLDPDNCVTLCPWANNAVDERQAGAELLGLLLPSWATLDHEVEARARRRLLAALLGERLTGLGLPSWRRDDLAEFSDRAVRDLEAWGFAL
jgi:5-methylcytosine-specific restriction endonuclease McrA